MAYEVRQRLLNGVSILSLAMFAASAVMAARSYWRHDSVSKAWQLPKQRALVWDATSARGRVQLIRIHTDASIWQPDRWKAALWEYVGDERLHYSAGPARQIGFHSDHWYQRIGFDLDHSVRDLGYVVTTSYVVVPDWLLVALFAAIPGARARGWVVRFPRERRRRRGLCEFCGYDLRAATGRCPECGNALSDAATTDTA